MSINHTHLREHVIRPALEHVGLWSATAENLVLGTALVESRGEYLRQTGGGPALGLWQMEPATHNDIWFNYLGRHPTIKRALIELETKAALSVGAAELVGNLWYGAAMCRVHYRRSPLPLPADPKDALALAKTWKQAYNTVAGAGTVAKALPFFKLACGV